MNKNTICTTAAGIVAAMVALANGQARGEEEVSTAGISISTRSVERPPRPENVERGKFKISELKWIVKSFEEEKKEFLKHQKRQQAESRAAVRADVNVAANPRAAKQEAKDSIADAKRVSREHARKVGDEAKEAAKTERHR